MNNNVLLTGATGFIGLNLVNALLKRNCNITALIRKTSNIEPLKGKNINFATGNINDYQSVSSILKKSNIDIVFHCAACVKCRSLSKLMLVNAGGTYNICRASLDYGVKRVVYISSIAVISGNRQSPLKDNMPYSATNKYGQSKIEAEKIAIKFRKKGLNISILRPCMVYGPGEPHALDLLLNLLKFRLFPILGKGNNLWHLVYIKNLVESIILASEKDKALTGTSIIADKEALSVNDTLNILSDALNVARPLHLSDKLTPLFSKIPLIKNKISFFRKNRIYDISRAVDTLEYDPSVSTENALKETARFWLKNKK